MQNKTYKASLQNEFSTKVSFPNITLTSDVECLTKSGISSLSEKVASFSVFCHTF